MDSKSNMSLFLVYYQPDQISCIDDAVGIQIPAYSRKSSQQIID